MKTELPAYLGGDLTVETDPERTNNISLSLAMNGPGEASEFSPAQIRRIITHLSWLLMKSQPYHD